MRILVLNYEFPPLGGGAAPASEALGSALVSRGHDVDVVTMGYRDLPGEESVRGMSVHRVPALRSSVSMSRPHEMASYLVTGFPRARRLVRERDHDVVLAHFIIPTGVLASLLGRTAGIPYYLVAHGSDVPGYNPDRFGLLHRLARPAWRRIVAGAEGIVSPSAYLRDLIHDVDAEAPVAVAPNGIDADAFDPDRPKAERVLLTGRLFERKGVQDVLEALATVDTDWEVVVTGDGPYREPLEARAARLDLDVRFTGWVDRDELVNLLETSAVYVFPSSHENCPVALLEAMAAGCAVVASRFSGTAEVAGDAALLVDPEDRSALAAAMERLLADPALRDRLQAEARDRVETRFDWDRIGAVYERLLASGAEHGVESTPAGEPAGRPIAGQPRGTGDR